MKQSEATVRGKVRWFDAKKGYGFIKEIGGSGRDCFAHYSEIVKDGFKSLDQDQEVEFHVIQTEKGLKAVGIVPASD